jgi:hypothetical protein
MRKISAFTAVIPVRFQPAARFASLLPYYVPFGIDV